MTYCNSCNAFRCRVGCTGKSAVRRGNSNANLADAALDSFDTAKIEAFLKSPVTLKAEPSDNVLLKKAEPVKSNPVNDAVNHPSHYTNHPSGIECIQVAEHMSFTIGNAIKYLWRAGIKSEVAHVQDLRKAIWYIEREISRIERKAA